MSDEQITRQLDLGCGTRPRNPMGCSVVYGVDIRSDVPLDQGVEVRSANLTIDPIPFEDSFFNSVSAFDVIEHIPRVFPGGAIGTRFPYIELMNEVWRVLKPGGYFYAVTPAYPESEAFQDPTHVNIVTEKTARYFCGPKPWAKGYGFKGLFDLECNERVLPYEWYRYETKQTLKRRWRHFWRGHVKGELTHLLWVWRAIK